MQLNRIILAEVEITVRDVTGHTDQKKETNMALMS